jgi:hypothetical protein
MGRIKEFREKLVEELDAGVEDGSLSVTEWWDQTYALSNVLDNVESGIGLDDVEMGSGDRYVQVTYYIPQISKSVVLDWDGYEEANTVDELADIIVKWEEEGRKLKKQIILSKQK